MAVLETSLFRRCCKALTPLTIFASMAELESVFSVRELSAYKSHMPIPYATTPREAFVRQVVSWLLEQNADEQGPQLFLTFLRTLLLLGITPLQGDLYKELSVCCTLLEKESTPAPRGQLYEPGQLAEVEVSPDTSRRVEQASLGNGHMIFSMQLEHTQRCILAVGEVTVPVYIEGQATGEHSQGTGWLITPTLAMTCWHVFNARTKGIHLHDNDLHAQVTNSVLHFDYLLPGDGVGYTVDALECYNPILDYAVFKLRDRQDHPLKQRGFLKLDVDVSLTRQTQLWVIQHPKGQPQQNSMGEFYSYKREQPECILHTAPAEGGTSGAPVINTRNWSVVALHNGQQEKDLGLCEALLLKKILSHIQTTQPDLYHTIMSSHVKKGV